MFFTPWSMKTKALKKYEDNQASQKLDTLLRGEK